jgi:hypothetical protein
MQFSPLPSYRPSLARICSYHPILRHPQPTFLPRRIFTDTVRHRTFHREFSGPLGNTYHKHFSQPEYFSLWLYMTDLHYSPATLISLTVDHTMTLNS